MTRRNIFTRFLAAMALVAVYIVGATAFMGLSTKTAEAYRGRGRGYYGGRGRGRGYGRGYGIYVAPPVYVAPRVYGGCYWSRRWQRRICTY